MAEVTIYFGFLIKIFIYFFKTLNNIIKIIDSAFDDKGLDIDSRLNKLQILLK